MRKLIASLAVAAAAFSTSAHATPIAVGDVWTSELNIISSNTIADPGTVLGEVKLTQVSLTQVDVLVTLLNGAEFVSTGGPHHAFAYQLASSATPYTVALVSSSSLFSIGGAVTNTPYGNFNHSIDCPGCGPGASNANPGPLEFTVSNAGGILLSDFLHNGPGGVGGYKFSSDVLGPNGGTGNIAGAPLPAAAWLFGSGLIGLGAVARRKRSA